MLVSISVAVYNGARYIPECIGCLAEQTYRDFEVIFVVDSKTTDDSVDVIKGCMGVLPEARVVIQTDGDRLAGARNIGVRESKGEVIWFLDVDDHPYPDFLSTLVPILIENDADIVFCNSLQLTSRTVPKEPEGHYDTTVMTAGEALRNMRRIPPYTWSHIQRRSIFDNEAAMFVPYPAIEDAEQTIMAVALSEKVCYCDKPLYVYYKITGSASSANRCKEAEVMEAIARRTLRFVSDNHPDSYPEFSVYMTERVMRTMTFGTYGVFRKVYGDSVAREVLASVRDRTIEMNVFLRSPLLYYMILYPFSHWLWDRKAGTWGRENRYGLPCLGREMRIVSNLLGRGRRAAGQNRVGDLPHISL